jgi:hypothetical protein
VTTAVYEGGKDNHRVKKIEREGENDEFDKMS